MSICQKVILVLALAMALVNCSNDESGESGEENMAGAAKAQGDTSPPDFFAIGYLATTSTLQVTWTTTEAASGQIEYGVTSAYGSSSALASSLTTAHDITITGLPASTSYHFRLLSSDASGNAGKSSGFIASTLANADVSPPSVVAGFTAPLISPTPALTVKQTTTPVTLSWTQSGAADFKEYRIYRHYAPGVTSSNTLLTTITTVPPLWQQPIHCRWYRRHRLCSSNNC